MSKGGLKLKRGERWWPSTVEPRHEAAVGAARVVPKFMCVARKISQNPISPPPTFKPGSTPLFCLYLDYLAIELKSLQTKFGRIPETNDKQVSYHTDGS